MHHSRQIGGGDSALHVRTSDGTCTTQTKTQKDREGLHAACDPAMTSGLDKIADLAKTGIWHHPR